MLYAIALLGTVLAGVLMAVQNPVNSSLGHAVGSLQATATSFAGGILCAVVLVALFGDGDLAKTAEVEPWMLLGGVYSAYLVWVVVVALPVLGANLAVAILMLAQLVMSVFIDTFGLLQAAPIPISPLRIAGIAVAAAGILVLYRAQTGERKRSGNAASKNEADVSPDDPASRSAMKPMSPLVAAILCFTSGIVGSMQPATNVALRSHVGFLESNLISFSVSFVVIFVALMIANRGRINSYRGVRPWQLVGGPLGIMFTYIGIFATPIVGVMANTLGNLFGQLGMSVLVDAFGLLGARRIELNMHRIAGILLVGLGVVLTSLVSA